MKLKVLHIINSLLPGGAETLLINSLSTHGLQDYTDNILVYFKGTSTLEFIIDKNVKVYCLGYKGIFSLPSCLYRLRSIIIQHKIEIVHSHLNPAGFYTNLICNVPQVHTIHTVFSMDTETTLMKRLFEKHFYFIKKNTNVILLTDYAREDFLNSVAFQGNTFVLNNFIPDKFFKSESKKYLTGNQSLKLIAVGRLNILKNFIYLIECFKYLKNFNIQLDIYGNGNIQEYEKLIRILNVKVRMMGHNEDMSLILDQYDLFIMPSKFEGFGLALYEAMASGLPVMLSNIKPFSSIVKDNAIYFELNDAKSTAEIIRKVFVNEIDIIDLAKKSRAFVEMIARKEKYIKKLLSIYKNVIQN